MPPPPPPPPGGPPPPPAMPNFKAAAAPDRGALLSQIRGGARLKKAVTNDRSAPLVSNKPNAPASGGGGSEGSSRGGGSSGGVASAGPPMGLGGLFSGGMPKLKPTGQRSALGKPRGGGESSSPSPPKESPPKEQPPPSRHMESANQTLAQAIANRAAKLNATSEKKAPTPVPKPSVTPSSFVKSPSPERPGPVHHETTNSVTTATPTVTSATHFPKDVSPPQQSRRGPPLPSKPPAANVNRSISQNQTKRPTHKPPPPPKFGTIGHQKRAVVSQTQPLARRQSFGALDSNAAALSVTKPQAAPPPPPPPRNMSVPNNMNTIHRNPPPVPPSLHSKKAPPQAPTTKPPPPPPNKTTMRSTPYPVGLVGGGSAMRAGRFESRFTFHNINDLSVSYEPTLDKKYPSRKKKSHQRKAPAPPLVSTES